MEQSIIVNDQDEIVGYKNRLDLDNNDFCRVSALLIKNTAWEFLLAQRWFNKRSNPWVWGASAAGIVEKWESYDDSIVKETREEIGVIWLEMKKVFKKRSVWKPDCFRQFYIAHMDEPMEYFTKQDDEVEALRWFSVDEIKKGSFEWNTLSEDLITHLDYFVAL